MSFRLSSKLNVIVLILLLSIGFAAVATNLIINGNARISSNPADFDVIFIEAESYWDANAEISSDGKTITWTSGFLTNPGEIAYLDYTVYNNSSNFDANVIINMNIEDVVNHVDYSGYYTIRTTTFDSTGYTVVPAKESVEGSIQVELVKPVTEDVTLNFTMSMTANPIERDVNVGPAQAPCYVVSGSGLEVGNEITCAGEEFYVLDHTSGYTRMMSKYNLMAGQIYGELSVTSERYSELNNMYESTQREGVNHNIINEPEFAEYKNLAESYTSYKIEAMSDNKYSIRIYLPDVSPDSGKSLVHQDPLAIGAHGTKLGEPDFPHYGIEEGVVFLCDEEDSTSIYGGGYFCDVIGGTRFAANEDYVNYLADRNILVEQIAFPTVRDIVDVIYRSSGRTLPLQYWFENQQAVGAEDGFSTIPKIRVLGDLKEYVPNGFEWLYSTTYWTNTVPTNAASQYQQAKDGDDLNAYTYFVDTLGMICSKWGCESAVGAGFRPVITINNIFIDYSTATSNGIDS